MSEPTTTQQKMELFGDPLLPRDDKVRLLAELVEDGALTVERAAESGALYGITESEVMDAVVKHDGPANGKADLHTIDDIEAGKHLLRAESFSNSDLIIDAALPGLRIFDKFYPYYEDAKTAIGAREETSSTGPVVPEQGDLGGSAGTYNHSAVDPNSLRAGLDEFRGIEFTAFRADADMLRTAGKTVYDATGQMDNAWSKNLGDWSGDAAGAARQRKSHVDKGAATVSQALQSGSDAITTTVDGYLQKNVSDFSSRILDMYGDGRMAGLTPKDVNGLLIALRELPGAIEKVNQTIQELNDRNLLDRAANWVTEKLSGVVGFVLGGPMMFAAANVGLHLQEITEDNIVAERDKYVKLLETSNTKLADFVREYTTRANEVHSQAAEYVAAIQKSYVALIESLKSDIAENPFAVAPAGGQSQGSGGSPAGVAGGSAGSAPSPAVGGGGGGAPSPGAGAVGGGGAVGGASGGGSFGPPSMTPSAADSPMTPNPITGKPLEVDSETGRPYPIDPETGKAVKEPEADVDTMTVRFGGNKIDITEPDSSGSMAITIDDGSGVAKQHRLDFSADGPAAGGQRAGPGGIGPVGGDASGSVGGPGASPVGGDAAGPATGPRADAQGVHTPGDDGAIRVRDGELTIVAERPLGPDGATVVTIGDGEDDRQTYVLGDEKAVAAYNRHLAQEETLLAGSGPADGLQGAAPGTAHDAVPGPAQGTGPGGAHGGAAAGAGSAASAAATPAPTPPPPAAPLPADAPPHDVGATQEPGATAPAADGDVSVQPASVGDGVTDSVESGMGKDSASGMLDSVFGVDHGVADDAFRDEADDGIGGSDAFEGARDGGGPGPAPGGAGVGVAPGGSAADAPADASAASGASSAMGAPMTGGGMGAMGGAGVGSAGGDEQRSGSTFQLDSGGLFEPDVAEGPFGVARISGSLDDDD